MLQQVVHWQDVINWFENKGPRRKASEREMSKE